MTGWLVTRNAYHCVVAVREEVDFRPAGAGPDGLRVEFVEGVVSGGHQVRPARLCEHLNGLTRCLSHPEQGVLLIVRHTWNSPGR